MQNETLKAPYFSYSWGREPKIIKAASSSMIFPKILKYHNVLAISFVIYVISVLENHLASKHMQLIKQVKFIGVI